MPDSSVLILAAGASTRMGQPKQLLQINGMSLLRKAAMTAIEADVGPVLVVLGCRAVEIANEIATLPVLTAINPAWSSGIGSSIRCGVEQLMKHSPSIQSIIIFLCDQPLIQPSHLRALLQSHQKSGLPICVSAFATATGPPVLISESFFEQLLLLDDSQGTKQLWSQRPDLVLKVPCGAAAADIDTPADYLHFSV